MSDFDWESYEKELMDIRKRLPEHNNNNDNDNNTPDVFKKYFQNNWSNTMIDKCDCKHEGQDMLHGGNNRVFNLCGAKADKIRCSVCNKEKYPKATEIKAKSK